jgi:hypothetical protein
MLEAAWAPPSTIARDVKRIIRPHTNCYSVVAVFIVFLRAKIYPRDAEPRVRPRASLRGGLRPRIERS